MNLDQSFGEKIGSGEVEREREIGKWRQKENNVDRGYRGIDTKANRNICVYLYLLICIYMYIYVCVCVCVLCLYFHTCFLFYIQLMHQDAYMSKIVFLSRFIL